MNVIIPIRVTITSSEMYGSPPPDDQFGFVAIKVDGASSEVRLTDDSRFQPCTSRGERDTNIAVLRESLSGKNGEVIVLLEYHFATQ